MTTTELLGHKNTDTVLRYLGITTEETHKVALENDIFTRPKRSYNQKRKAETVTLSDKSVKQIITGFAQELRSINSEALKSPVVVEELKSGGVTINVNVTIQCESTEKAQEVLDQTTLQLKDIFEPLRGKYE